MNLRFTTLSLLLSAAFLIAPTAFSQEKAKPASTKEAKTQKTARPNDAKKETPQGAASNPHAGNPHAANPHAGATGAMNGPIGRNLSSPASDIPQGQIHVEVLGAQGQPIGGVAVNLRTNFQSISQGNSDDVKTKKADPSGRVVFDGLDNALRYSYGIEVVRDGAKYEVPSFRLQKIGHKVRIYTYPTTSDQLEAFVASRGYAHVQIREDFYRVDVMYRVINAGKKTWIPKGVRIDLPDHAQAVDTAQRKGDTGFKEDAGDVILDGSYPPGNNDVQFSFQIPTENTETLAFQMGVMPHLLDLTVLAQEAPGMTLKVPGFEATESRPGPDGKPALFTGKNLRTVTTPLESITIELGGLPVVGPGRWIAAAFALLLALGALLFSGSRKDEKNSEVEEEKNEARRVLLDEMALLESAKGSGEIGPRTYEQTRREILMALARLEPQTAS